MTIDSITIRSKHFCILCLTSLLACACSAESDVPADDALVPLRIGSVSLETETTHTRSTTSKLTKGDIGVFLRKNGSDTESTTNTKFSTTNGTTWTPATTLYVSSKPSKIAAYYPYIADLDATNKTNWTLPLTAQVYSDATDLVYDNTQTVDAANPTINFRMKHVYGRLKILVKRGTYDGTGTVTAVSIYYYVTSTTFSLATNTYGNQNGTSGETVERTGFNQTIGADATEIADFLLPPCTQPYTFGANINSAEVHCTIDGKELIATLGEGAKDDYLPQAGVCKTLTVTVNGKGLEFGAVTIGDWTTSTEALKPTWD